MVWALLPPRATVTHLHRGVLGGFRAEPPPLATGKPGNYAVWLLVRLVTMVVSSPWPSARVSQTCWEPGCCCRGAHPECHPGVVGSAIATASQTLIEFGHPAGDPDHLRQCRADLVTAAIHPWRCSSCSSSPLTTGPRILNVCAGRTADRHGDRAVDVLPDADHPPDHHRARVLARHPCAHRDVDQPDGSVRGGDAGRCTNLRVPTLGQTAMLLGWTLAVVLFARLVYVKLGRVGG